jgi:hypothetical protein
MTPSQYYVLLLAQGHGRVQGEHRIAPHGVFRSLVLAQYLRSEPDGYAITPEGRDAARAYDRAQAARRHAEARP